jgi:hypothetical protein
MRGLKTVHYFLAFSVWHLHFAAALLFVHPGIDLVFGILFFIPPMLVQLLPAQVVLPPVNCKQMNSTECQRLLALGG